MMNRTILFKIFLLVACIGCTGNLPENDDNALQLSSVSVDEGGISKGTGTVTSIDKVCVYVATENYEQYDETVSSLVFTNESGNWTSDKAVIMKNGVNAKVYGAFPADAGITNDNGNLKVNVEVLKGGDNTLDFLGSQQSDYLYSAGVSASYDARTISLTMKHAMAKVSFRIVKGADVTETLLLKQVKILSNTDLLQAGSGYMLLNVATGAATLNGLASTSQITMDNSAGTELKTAQSSPNVTCLVAPMSTSESVLSFSITVAKKGDTLERTFTTSSISPAVKWEAGFHYTYRITVNKMSGDVDGVLIEDWQNDASQNTSVGI